jgi:iron complex transport system substrate-binding protein
MYSDSEGQPGAFKEAKGWPRASGNESRGSAMSRRMALALCLLAGLARAKEVEFAQGFSIDHPKGYTLVKVANPFNPAGKSSDIALYPGTRPIPKDLPQSALALATPLKRVCLTSSTQAAFFALLGLEDKVVGLSCGYLANTPSLAARYQSGDLAEISTGPEMSGRLDLEKLSQLKPDLVMCYPLGSGGVEIQPKLAEAGFTAVVDNEYREGNPLARAEWVKFVAAFFGKEREAGKIFNRIARDYQALKKKAGRAGRQPAVFVNTDFKGVWWMPAGSSYMAVYLADAGADYLWKGEAGSKPLALATETVFARAREADFWLNPGTSENLKALSSADARLAGFKAFRNGQVYNFVAKVNARGGNDFWEGGVARPDLVLKDLVKIFHPDLVPGHEWIWYKKIN